MVCKTVVVGSIPTGVFFGVKMNTILGDLSLIPAQTLLMSKKNCHAKHVSSIVLINSNGILTRAFLAWPGHQLFTNRIGSKFAVGIHNHRYDLNLKFVAGSDVFHDVYQVTDKVHVKFNKWTFSSGGTNVHPTVTADGKENLFLYRSFQLDKVWRFCDNRVLHTIRTDGPACWLVKESKPVNDITTLYTTTDTVETSGLYESFASVEEVVNHVKEFEKCLN
jgi:hypothetical protein